MEKIPPPAKNEMFDERLAVVEAKINEIVNFINAIDDTAVFVPGQDLPSEYGGERQK